MPSLCSTPRGFFTRRGSRFSTTIADPTSTIPNVNELDRSAVSAHSTTNTLTNAPASATNTSRAGSSLSDFGASSVCPPIGKRRTTMRVRPSGTLRSRGPSPTDTSKIR
jgi:hypothetical protein